jgi:general secretion pathway protein G
VQGKSFKKVSGLTLLELLVGIALISLISSIALPTYTGMREAGNVQAAIADIRAIEEAAFRYSLTHAGEIPSSLNDIGRQNLLDPWGNPYQYRKIPDDIRGVAGLRRDRNLLPINSDFDLYSKGVDGDSQDSISAANSLDDVLRANDGNFIGLASDY